MTEKLQPVLISRRAFSLLGAALGVALPTTIMAISRAEAQTPGMERREDRQDRRDDRVERRGGVDATTGAAPAPPK